jgi:hypothetical protein
MQGSKPPQHHTTTLTHHSPSPTTNHQNQQGTHSRNRGSGSATATRFTYDQVFTPRASQEAVFAEVLPLVQSALDGYKVRGRRGRGI